MSFCPAIINKETYQIFLSKGFETVTAIALANNKLEHLIDGVEETLSFKVNDIAQKRKQDIQHFVRDLNTYGDLKEDFKDSLLYKNYKKVLDQTDQIYFKVTYSSLPICNSISLCPSSAALKNCAFQTSRSREEGIYGLNQVTGILYMTKDSNEITEKERDLKEQIKYCISRFDYSYEELNEYFNKHQRFLPLFNECYQTCKNEAEIDKLDQSKSNEILFLSKIYNEKLKEFLVLHEEFQKGKEPIENFKKDLNEKFKAVSLYCKVEEILEHPKITNESRILFAKMLKQTS